jgi:hypothetical protein
MDIREFIKDNPTRVAALVSAAVALIAPALFPQIPVEAAIGFVLSVLGVNEIAQRKENKLWDEAKATPAFDEVAD